MFICICLYYAAIECPAGMVYQQCGPVCPQTCDTDEDEDCSNGCIEGCFCPKGKVLFNSNCINTTECAGNMHSFPCIPYIMYVRS